MFMDKTLPRKRDRLSSALLVLACLGVSACTTAPSSATGEAGFSDPYESTNRAVFAFNDSLDKTIGEPVARGYREAVPSGVRKSVRNVLHNLRSPVNIANQALQGDVRGFASDTMRMLINTTIGIGGLFDVAESAGLKYEPEDFGQTLGVWGVGHGPYLVVPVLGPNSLRDYAGGIVDMIADPLRIYLFNTDQEEWYYARAGVTALDRREELLDALKDLQESSIDYYAAVRSAQYQYREALLKDQDSEQWAAPAIPDYDKGEE